MIEEQLNRPVTKLSLSLIEDPAREHIAFFNPETLEESLAANYASHDVPGLPRKPMHYINTSNLTVSVRLRFKAETTEEVRLLAEGRRFLHACHYPLRLGGPQQQGGAPPRIFLFWPPEWSIVVHIRSLSGEAKWWNADGDVLWYECTVGFEEVLTQSLTFEDVYARGTVRGSRKR